MRMARPRTVIPVDRIPLVGGCLCLDFVNTTGARASVLPRERLAHYRDLLVWCQRAGVVDERAATSLRRTASRQPDAASKALARAQALRERLYALFSALATGRQPDVGLVSGVARHWRAARNGQELVMTRNGFEVRFAAGCELDCMIPAIVMSAVELMTSERLRRLARCAECDWLFIDESKNGTRRWCKPMCGNRARSRKRYGRRRAQDARTSRSRQGGAHEGPLDDSE
jgi:predicted RNA-binding Zn ribbon-like protein